MLRPRFASIRSLPRRSQLTLAAVAVIVLAALALLYRTESNAAQVSRETQRIASSGRGLNSDTDAIARLDRTNLIAGATLTSLTRVNGDLSGIEAATRRIGDKATSIHRSTQSIDGSTTSINSSEHSVDGSVNRIGAAVGDLNRSLDGVNANAAHILSPPR